MKWLSGPKKYLDPKSSKNEIIKSKSKQVPFQLSMTRVSKHIEQKPKRHRAQFNSEPLKANYQDTHLSQLSECLGKVIYIIFHTQFKCFT